MSHNANGSFNASLDMENTASAGDAPLAFTKDEDVITVGVDRMSVGSAGIGKDEDGKTVFVEGGAPGDTVRAKIVEEKKSFSRALVTEVVSPGDSRIPCKCEFWRQCGGCPWQHISYEAQLEAKRSNVVESLVRTAGVERERAERVVAPIKGCDQRWGYRNKIEMNAAAIPGKGLQVGFAHSGTHDFFTPKKCLVAEKSIAGAPKALRGALRYLQGNDDLGLFRIGARGSRRTGELEVALWGTPGPFPRARAAKTIASCLKTTSITRIVADPSKKRSVKSVERLDGRGCWKEVLHGCEFLTSSPSFFQVNTAQAETLVECALGYMDVDEGDEVVDLYAGGGTFSIPLAKTGAVVSAIESVSSSISDLRRNAENNGVFVDAIGGDASHELRELEEVDALLVDPPRTGLASDVPQNIFDTGAKRLVYVSCNPATWARDVQRLEALGFSLLEATPVDMFPQTYHCEVVSTFDLSR